MADNLSLRINISSAEAARKLKEINKLLLDSEKAAKSLDKAFSGVGNSLPVSGTKDLKTSVDAATESTKKLGSKWQELAKKIGITEKNGQRMGRMFAANMGTAAASTFALTKNVLSLGAALTGIGGVKVMTDYMDFSKSAGQLNAIVKGGLGSDGKYSTALAGQTGRGLENLMVGATAGTGFSAAELTAGTQSLASTTQFDPTEGGKFAAGTEKYKQNLQNMADLMQRTGMFAQAMNTDLGVMTEGMIKYAGVFGYNLNDMDDVITVQDKFNGLLNTSQGGLERLVPQISKFGQEFKMLGVSENEQLGLFSTLTNVFDPEEAGTRTLAIANWIQSNARKLGPISEKFGKEIGDKFQNAIYNPDGSRKQMVEQITNVMDLMAGMDTQMGQDLFGSTVYSEIRQASGVKSLNSLLDTYKKTVEEINKTAGLSEGSIDAYMSVSGAKMDLFFNSMANSAQSAFGAVMDIMFSLGDSSKFDSKGFEDGLKKIGKSLNQYLGEGADAPVQMMMGFVGWLNNNRDVLKRFGAALSSMGNALSSVGKVALDLVSSGPFKAFMDFVAGNPAAAIGSAIAVTGVAGAIKNIFSSAISGAFASAGGGLASALGSSLVAAFGMSAVAAAIGAAMLIAIGVWREKERADKHAEGIASDAKEMWQGAQANAEDKKTFYNSIGNENLADLTDLALKRSDAIKEVEIASETVVRNRGNPMHQIASFVPNLLNGRDMSFENPAAREFLGLDKLQEAESKLSKITSHISSVYNNLPVEDRQLWNQGVTQSLVQAPQEDKMNAVAEFMKVVAPASEQNMSMMREGISEVTSSVATAVDGINSKINNPVFNINNIVNVDKSGNVTSSATHTPASNSAGTKGGATFNPNQ